MRMTNACSAILEKEVMKTAFFCHFFLLTYDVTQSTAAAWTAGWRLETACICAPAQPSRLLRCNKPKKSFILLPNTLKCQIFNSNLTSTVVCKVKFQSFYHVHHMNLQIACAVNVSQIENLKAINRHILHRYFAWFMLLFNWKAVLSW